MNLRSDNTFVEDRGWHKVSNQYNYFIRRHKDLHILFLEIGVAYNTSAIIKYFFRQMTARNSKAVYVCLNYGEAICPPKIERQSICIEHDIEDILRRFLFQERSKNE